MMVGHITDRREPVLRIAVRRRGGPPLEIDAVVDTGFNGHLTLPRSEIAQLALQFHGLADCILADGRSIVAPRYRAEVTWHGKQRKVTVIAGDGGPLLGMSLLYGSRVTFDAKDDGTLTIELLS